MLICQLLGCSAFCFINIHSGLNYPTAAECYSKHGRALCVAIMRSVLFCFTCYAAYFSGVHFNNDEKLLSTVLLWDAKQFYYRI